MEAEKKSNQKLFPGLTLGEYTLVNRLGRGAMGEVWLAKGSRGEVALKFPRRPDFLRYLRREEEVVNKIDHPYIARVFHSELKGELPYLVMEKVEGRSLRSLCTGTISPSEATLLCDQILQGLEAIHKGGYLHLDLKPENIMVEPSGQIKIVDLGLGKASSQVMAEAYLSASLVSREVPLAGTLAYMAPEQRKGKDLDWRTDLYAFGVLLHELLSGQLPSPALRLSQIREDLAPRWDVIIAKLTHPRPKFRPKNARQARQLVAFTLAEKYVNPIAEGGLPPRDLTAIDEKALAFQSPYRKGQIIGGYRLLSPLGRGGYGEVWEARGRGQKVALKLALGENAERALGREAKIMEELRHPSIPQLIKDGTEEDPSHLVLELIEGRSLRFLLNEKEKLPWEEALEIFALMTEAVEACHLSGVIHGDLKPEHFVIDTSEKRLWLIDFGLAQWDESRRKFDHSLATSEHSGGTYDYMAPEQKKGQTGPPADIYALGVCLFEMISGNLPRGPQRLGMLEGEIPEWLDQLVLRLLSPHPESRPAIDQVLEPVEKKVPAKVFQGQVPSLFWPLLRISLVFLLYLAAMVLLLMATVDPIPYALVTLLMVLDVLWVTRDL